jgi:hypothetical protein
MMNGRTKWMALGASAALAWTLGCGGGGGSSGSGGAGGTGQISGSLSHSATVQVALAARRSPWLARARAWMGPGSAFAEGTTDCGNPTTPAEGVPVALLNASGAVVQTTTTNADGEFVFTGLAAGDYVVQVTLPNATLSTPATVQDGQTTTLSGELEVDCEDANANGNKTEIELKVKQRMPDGDEVESEDIEDHQGDQSGPGNGTDGEDHHGSSSSGPGSGEDSSGRGGSSHGED